MRLANLVSCTRVCQGSAFQHDLDVWRRPGFGKKTPARLSGTAHTPQKHPPRGWTSPRWPPVGMECWQKLPSGAGFGTSAAWRNLGLYIHFFKLRQVFTSLNSLGFPKAGLDYWNPPIHCSSLQGTSDSVISARCGFVHRQTVFLSGEWGRMFLWDVARIRFSSCR